MDASTEVRIHQAIWQYRPGEVTVIIPTIPGREPMLSRAVGSVLAQSRAPEELLVCRDMYGVGAADMRNYMLARVQTEWTAFLDDDDELLGGHLEKLMGAAGRYPPFEGPDLYYSYFRPEGWTDPLVHSCPANGAAVSPFGIVFGAEQRAHLLNVDNFIPVTVLARTHRCVEVGGFQAPGEPPSPPFDRDDLGLWRALLKTGSDFEHVPAVTWVWKRHASHNWGLPPAQRSQQP